MRSVENHCQSQKLWLHEHNAAFRSATSQRSRTSDLRSRTSDRKQQTPRLKP
jgi:hypothetical protein